MNPHQVTKDFERALCQYTGARYAVAVNSCTMALLLAVAWHLRNQVTIEDGREWVEFRRTPIEIPKRTYVSVPMSIIHAGGRPTFRDEAWRGAYQLKPLPVFDSARWLTSGMYDSDQFWTVDSNAMVCVSFHATKTLADTQGGAILHDNYEADQWLRRARFDGRTEGVPPNMDNFTQIGWHCYLSPDVSTRLLWAMAALPKHNDPLPSDDYPDLSQMAIFQ
jgi:dTDP-4-amino-4,6-dideoxygalactose transaminase